MQRTFLAVLAAVVWLSACGGSESSTVTSPNDDRPASFDEIEYESPIGAYLGFDFTAADGEDQFAEMQRTADRITTECMLAEGFEFSPMNGNQVEFFESTEELAYYSDEWVAKYGFGVSTQYFSQSRVGPGLVGSPNEDFSTDEAIEDPNQEYQDSLSEAERQAYNEALFGAFDQDFGDEDGAVSVNPFESDGCMNKGFNEAFNAGNQMGFFEEFGRELEELEERAEADPRTIEYRRRVADCVAEQGESWTADDDPYERFNRRLGDLGPSFPDFASASDEVSDEEPEEYFQAGNELSDEDKALLGEIQAEEIALAKIVVGCDGGELNEFYFLGEIRIEFEQKFLDENADRLAELDAEG